MSGGVPFHKPLLSLIKTNHKAMLSANRSSEEEQEEKHPSIEEASSNRVPPSRLAFGQRSALLQKLRKNWIVLVIIILGIVTFFYLQSVKSSLIASNGDIASYKNPLAPDLSKKNKDLEDAQKQLTRLDIANQVNGKIDEAVKDTNREHKKEVGHPVVYVRYSTSNVYGQTQNPSGGVPSGGVPSGGVPSGGVPSGGVPSGGVLSGGVPSGGVPSAPNNAISKVEYAVKKRRSTEKISGHFNNATDGFNTVVLSGTPPSSNSSSLAETKQTLKQNSHSGGYIKAAVYGNQVVRSGSQVRIRLLESLQIDGERNAAQQEIPANSLCTGIAVIGSNRVAIALTSVQVGGQQISIKKMVCDKDLLPGISFFGEDALQQGMRQQRNAATDRTTNNVLSNIPQAGGIAGVAIGTGAEIATSISNTIRYGGIQKRLGEVTLEEGYKVFIKE